MKCEICKQRKARKVGYGRWVCAKCHKALKISARRFTSIDHIVPVGTGIRKETGR